MIRDPGPISSLGYGLTSRDIPYSGDEREGISPNSGFISKALNDHPITRFIASTAAVVASSLVLNKMIKRGGLKLGKFIQDTADSGSGIQRRAATRFVDDAVKLRQYLDELEGYSRRVGGPEEAGKLVFTRDGTLTTGYDSIVDTSFDTSKSSVSSWFTYKTKDDLRSAASGITGENAASWSYRDELQRRLVRSGRQLPYTLPALYGAEKIAVEPFFGSNEKKDKQFKWYNPADVISDFTLKSLKNIATFILPFDALGASSSAAKSSLNTLAYSRNEMNALTPMKKKMHEGFMDVAELLSEVGHDSAHLLNKALRFSSRASKGLSASAHEFKNESGLTINLHNLRHGMGNAQKAATAKRSSKNFIKNATFDDIITGFKNASPADISGSLFDRLPILKRLKSTAQAGVKEYKISGKAYEAMQKGAIFDDIVKNSNGLVSSKTLQDSINRIQSLQGTGLSHSLKSLSVFGGRDTKFTSSEIFKEVQLEEYKKLVYGQLKRNYPDLPEEQLRLFVSNLKITNLPKTLDKSGIQITDPTEVVSIGKQAIYKTDSAEYFKEILERYKGTADQQISSINPVKRFGKQKRAFKAQQSLSETIDPLGLSNAISKASEIFVDPSFENKVYGIATKKWNKFIRQDAPGFLSKSLGSKKASFADYIGDLSAEQKVALQRKTAQKLGIALTDKSGDWLPMDLVIRELKGKNIDPYDFINLRRFLVANKELTSGILPSGANIVGLKPLTVKEVQEEEILSKAFPNKIYDNPVLGPLSREEYLLNLVSNYNIIDDPLSGGIANKIVKGVYKTSGGEVVDTTAISELARKTGRFLGTELKFPILSFNPANLFAYGELKNIADANSIQYISKFSVQPFAKPSQLSDEAYQIFYKTKPTKGKVISYSSINERGELLQGEYRPLLTDSSGMLADSARAASGLSGLKGNQVTGQSGSKLLNRLLGEERTIALKDKFSISAEQPNSLIGFIQRFSNRNSDITNPKIIGGLLSPEGATINVGGKKTIARIASVDDLQAGGKVLSVVDDAGTPLLRKGGGPLYSENEILRSVDSLHRRLGNYAQPLSVMKQAEEAELAAMKAAKDAGKVYSPKFTLAGGNLRVSEVNDESALFDVINTLDSEIYKVMGQMSKSGSNPGELAKSWSRVKSRASTIEFSALAQGFEKSGVKTTEFDEIKNELFNFVTTFNSIRSGVPKKEISEELLKIADDLFQSGSISSSLKAESQLSTLYNTINDAAFTTYSAAAPRIQNARQRVDSLLGILKDPVSNSSNQVTQMGSSLDPLTRGTEAYIGGGVKTFVKPITPKLKTTFGMGEYRMGEAAIDPLGSGQSTTLVPTLRTAVNNVGITRVLGSASGVTTYSDPEAYSMGSVPVQHTVQRLDKYFSSVGTGFDTSDYSGPLSMFANGMVGRRVLPMYAAGTTAITADRIAGGLVGDEDEQGRPIYKPLVTTGVARGVVEAQAVVAGIMPGGMSYSEKKEQLLEGEVPIRQGRYWPLGNTKFSGGKIKYYRPSWYRRLESGASYTEDTYGSPTEKFLYYNDISPLRPLDPYRFERKHYEDRPYPLTGEYFTGPFGPMNTIANATIGRVLKPQVRMHEEEVNQALSSYAPVGQMGAYSTAGYGSSGQMAPSVGNQINVQTAMNRGSASTDASIAQLQGQLSGHSGPLGVAQINSQSTAPGVQSGRYAQTQITGQNTRLANAAGPLNTAMVGTRNAIAGANANYVNSQYGTPKSPGVMPPKIVPVGTPIETGSMQYQAGDLSYRMQEMAGIYGFAFASARESLGLGDKDVQPNKSVLQSASKAYGISRAFWDLNLGGLGDVPLPSQDAISNIEFSEIVRRFIPKERTGVDYINPIKNTMGKEHKFLPGPEYFTDFTTGDPYTRVQEGELRLPGIGYERLNKLYPDENGRYGVVNQLDILGDVAPYSKQYKSLDKRITKMNLSEDENKKVEQIRGQVAQTTKKYEFSDYKFKGKSYGETGGGVARNAIGRTGEYIAHADNFIVSKTIGKRTAVEDWERSNVYGTTFPEWQRPVESYIKPMIYKATQRDPVTAAVGLGIFGALVGVGNKGRLITTTIGAVTGAAAGVYGNLKEEITGSRYMPERRKKELALEEYTDILNYVKNKRLENISRQQGDAGQANKYRMASQRTMYGAPVQDIGTGKYGTDVESLSLAIPKRKREHFKSMINAPEDQRERILSTSGRLERRIYEASWGAKVEERPDLTEYFAKRELPDSSWEGWHQNTNMEHVKIKMGQSMGLEMSEMGYYPQQIKEANLTNPSYPDFLRSSDKYYPSEKEVSQKLRQLMNQHGLTGRVNKSSTPYGDQRISINQGM